MTFFPSRSAGKDRIKSHGSGSSPNRRAYKWLECWRSILPNDKYRAREHLTEREVHR
jgi:hypothetical protein